MGETGGIKTNIVELYRTQKYEMKFKMRENKDIHSMYNSSVKISCQT